MTDTIAATQLNELLPHAIVIAKEAGAAILELYRQVDPAVEYKRDRSPLTQGDLISHRLIVEGLKGLTPEWPVLSEESREIPFDLRQSWKIFWLVDPLDGTKEFLRQNDEFTVNIALMAENRPILGVVYAPAIGRLYYAARGLGAWKDDRGALSQIHVAQPQNGCLRLVVSKSHSSGEENLDRFTSGAEQCEFVSMGSSLKFCLVAEGAADLYPRMGPTMEWDTAAAQCVVEQAGGSVTALDGSPIEYNKPVLLNPGLVACGSQQR